MIDGVLEPEARAFAPAHGVKLPLASDAREAKRRHCAQTLRATDDPVLAALADQLVPVRTSATSQVYRARSPHGDPLIVKVHADPAAFSRELAAYRVLAPSGRVPLVRRVSSSARLLVLEDVGVTPLGATVDDVCALAEALGHVHATASSQPLVLASLAPGCSIGGRARRPPPPWVVDVAAYHAALAIARRRWSTMHVPVALGDLKPEHVRRRPGGQIVFFDLETFSPGTPEEIDLLSLANFVALELAGPAELWRRVLTHYHRGRTQDAPEPGDLVSAHDCLRLMARAIGVEGPR